MLKSQCPITMKQRMVKSAIGYIKALGVSLEKLMDYTFGKTVAYALNYGADIKHAKELGYKAVQNMDWVKLAGNEKLLLRIRDTDHANYYEEYRLYVQTGKQDDEILSELKSKSHRNLLSMHKRNFIGAANMITKVKTGQGNYFTNYEDAIESWTPEFLEQVCADLGIMTGPQKVVSLPVVSKKDYAIKVDTKNGHVTGYGLYGCQGGKITISEPKDPIDGIKDVLAGLDGTVENFSYDVASGTVTVKLVK